MVEFVDELNDLIIGRVVKENKCIKIYIEKDSSSLFYWTPEILQTSKDLDVRINEDIIHISRQTENALELFDIYLKSINKESDSEDKRKGKYTAGCVSYEYKGVNYHKLLSGIFE